MTFEHLLVQHQAEAGTVLLRINRPEVRNALNRKLMDEIVEALSVFELDDTVRAVVLTGDDKAFAAGADITEMAEATVVDMLNRDQFAKWDRIKRFKKPLIAAVSGFALGGGCELSMHCDMIVASETAKFGQPEIKIGVMPGAGGTQRLTRAVGKALAMEMVLAGRFITAQEAHAAGLINGVYAVEEYLPKALELAAQCAQMPPVAVRLAKESVLKAFELSLEEGLHYERKNFYLLFGTEDQSEGMAAFREKRPPVWKGR
jgi:enoyl-CoA hydratase